jgi:hypothetical protein
MTMVYSTRNGINIGWKIWRLSERSKINAEKKNIKKIERVNRDEKKKTKNIETRVT